MKDWGHRGKENGIASFTSMIKAAIAVYGYERLAQMLSCSKPTADRWASGKSAPALSYQLLIGAELDGLLLERKALIDLLSHPAGYGVQMAGTIEIRNLEDETIAVSGEELGYEETVHESVEEAVDKFLKIRHETEYGLDYDEEACLREAEVL
jgi:hypothetical protein